MNYGRQTSFYPQRLNQMQTNWNRFISFDDTNRIVDGLINIIPETLGTCDNHNNREAFFLTQTTSPAAIKFNTLRYSRSGGNLDSTLKSFTITLLPSTIPGYFIGSRKITDSQYQLYFIDDTEITATPSITITLFRWTFYLTNQETAPYTGSYVEDELVSLTVSSSDTFSPPVVVGSKAYVSTRGTEGVTGPDWALLVADILEETFEFAENLNYPSYTAAYGTPSVSGRPDPWYIDKVFGQGWFIMAGTEPDYDERYYRNAAFYAQYQKEDSSGYAWADYYYQITGDHYKFNHHRWIHKYIAGEHLYDPPIVDEYYEIGISEQDDEVGSYTESLVEFQEIDYFEHLYDDPVVDSDLFSSPVLFNKGISGIVKYDGDWCLYDIDGGLGAAIEPPLNCVFYHDPLNCVDDISGSLYMLVVDEYEGTINLVTIDGDDDGETGTNRVIESDFRFSSETAAVNFGNFIFTFQPKGWKDKTNGHLIYFCDDIDGASQVIMLPEIQ